MNLSKIISDYWITRQFFYRPDPLGFCVIQIDMFETMRKMKMSVVQRQMAKGYMKK
jgi:hypothetical protein